MFRHLLRLLVVLALLLPTQAGATKVLVASGPWSRAADWSPEGHPTAPDQVEIPAGLEARLKAAAACRSIYVAGTIGGSSSLTVGGSVTFTPTAHAVETLDLTLTANSLLPVLTFGEVEPMDVLVTGNAPYRLGGPTRVFATFIWGNESNLNTQGYPVTVQGESKLGVGQTLTLGTTRWQTGEWRPWPPSMMNLTANEATIVLKDPSEGTFEGQKQTYGNVTIEGFNPHSKNPYTVLGVLALNQTEDSTAIKLERGQRITVGTLASNGDAINPVRIVSSEAGQPATIVLPHSEELAAVMHVSDLTVEGGPLYLPNGEDEGDNSGIVFTAEP